MENPLNRIYQEYKESGNKGTHGVPKPIFDGEFEPDFTKVRSCPECGSLNVSFDVSTNQTVCNECHKSTDKPTRIDFQREMDQIKEEDQERIDAALKRGNQFG